MINLKIQRNNSLFYIIISFLLFECGLNEKPQNAYNSENKKSGIWLEAYNDTIIKSSYKNGVRNGQGIINIGDSVVIKGKYNNGKLHGNWIKYVSGEKRKHYLYVSEMLVLVTVYKDNKVVKTISYSPLF